MIRVQTRRDAMEIASGLGSSLSVLREGVPAETLEEARSCVCVNPSPVAPATSTISWSYPRRLEEPADEWHFLPKSTRRSWSSFVKPYEDAISAENENWLTKWMKKRRETSRYHVKNDRFTFASRYSPRGDSNGWRGSNTQVRRSKRSVARTSPMDFRDRDNKRQSSASCLRHSNGRYLLASKQFSCRHAARTMTAIIRRSTPYSRVRYMRRAIADDVASYANSSGQEQFQAGNDQHNAQQATNLTRRQPAAAKICPKPTPHKHHQRQRTNPMWKVICGCPITRQRRDGIAKDEQRGNGCSSAHR